jgi:phytoene dehydrogenase-like protein
MNKLTVVGGGLGGLTSAVAAAECGFDVVMHEAKDRLGGCAVTTGGEFRANVGPHVLYDDGPFWKWLEARGLTVGAARVPKSAPMYFRIDGRRRRLPEPRLVQSLRAVRRGSAPIEVSFRDWATCLVGDRHAGQLANFAGVVIFDHDPGRFSARFVQERIQRATKLPPAARYIPGGWGTLVERLRRRAIELGISISTGEHIDQLPPAPVILAIPHRALRRLIDGDDLVTTTACLDLGLQGQRPPFILSDLDASGWVETFSRPDPSLAPRGYHLIQAQAGIKPGETLDLAANRIEALLEVADPSWRSRETWRRATLQVNRTGALDLPNRTWQDRAAIDRGGGVMLVNDQVAAPGLLSEVTHAAAMRAVHELRIQYSTADRTMRSR